jgi:hypothetical protein
VSVLGSIAASNSGLCTLGAGCRQADVRVAVQPVTSSTASTLEPPSLTAYAVPVRVISANWFGSCAKPGFWFALACCERASAPHSPGCVPSHLLVSIAASVSSTAFMTNAVCNGPSIATNPGEAPVTTAGAVCAHPVPTVALHRAPLMTDTVPSLKFAT